jgi:hypothetical protein
MKKIVSLVVGILLVGSLSVVAFTNNGDKTAKPSKTSFVMDGKAVTFDMAYSIDGANYIQLRSVAQMLTGTASQFNVYWDDAAGKAVIQTGVPYTGEKPIASATKTSGYQAIYDEYAKKLRDMEETAGISEKAEMVNKGILEMAEYMYKAKGVDGQMKTYSEWGNKLQEVYMDVCN